MVAALALLAGACGQGSKISQSLRAPQASGPRILQMRFFRDGSGWLVADRGVLRTTDRGRSWTNVTPPRLRGRALDEVSPIMFFRTRTEGWLAAFLDPSTPTTLSVLRTTDGGRTWRERPLAVDLRGEDPGGGVLFSLDDRNAWLVIKAVSGSAHSRGVLYRTTDGGESWRRLEIPMADAIRFTTPQDGWMAGGPAGGALFVTRDGGLTWQEQVVPGRHPVKPWRTTVALPVFFDADRGVLPVQTRLSETSETSLLQFYVTGDRGNLWLPAGAPVKTDRGGDIFFGGHSMASFVDADNWFLLGEGLQASRDGGRTWSVVNDSRDLRDAVQIEFASPSQGFVYVVRRECPQPKQCTETSELLRSDDGGRTWRAVQVPTA